VFTRRRLGLLSLERLDKLLKYDPETGFFTVLEASGHRRIGDVIGKPVRDGDGVYTYITIDRQQYTAHQIAWYIFHRKLQREGYHIYHINGKRGDNRIENLREVTPRENARARDKRLYDSV
jgi:hypothetical protein